ncbi:MAG TPA: single-stranded DNA-binding protein [candidate division Zixibacteria bacterium]|nr:single-stranded DNA-binding protein [candidate division Zixibacteria bacterium]
MFNKVILIGRLGQDPEMRFTPSGTAVTNFSVATNRKWRDKSGELQEETTWHDVVCWGKQAEFIGEYCSKGRLVMIEGELRKRQWEDKNGATRVSVEINARDVRMLESGKKPGESGGRPNRDAGHSSSHPDAPEDHSMDTEDDVPF